MNPAEQFRHAQTFKNCVVVDFVMDFYPNHVRSRTGRVLMARHRVPLVTIRLHSRVSVSAGLWDGRTTRPTVRWACALSLENLHEPACQGPDDRCRCA